jgi:TolB protein
VLSKDGGPKIYTVDVASKKLSRLTDGTGIDTEPSWSPDGQSIVFTSNRGGKPQIYRVSLSSGKTERLTFNGDYNAKPSLTPDGKRLVMLHRGDNGSFSIAVQNLSNSDLKVLTNTSLNDSPSIAPNGMMVMYGSKDGERGVLGAVTLDGRVKIRIPSREGNVQEPAWSPFN